MRYSFKYRKILCLALLSFMGNSLNISHLKYTKLHPKIQRKTIKTAAISNEFIYYIKSHKELLINSTLSDINFMNDRCMSVSSNSGENIYTFRGTLVNRPMEWITNFNSKLVSSSFSNSILVHKGYLSEYMRIREELIQCFQKNKNKKTIITAHSSGCAFAIFFALDINELYPDKELTLITFGMPKIGNQEFVSFINNKEKINQEHVTANTDIVTKFPLNKKYKSMISRDNLKPFSVCYLLNFFNIKKLINSHSMKEYSHKLNSFL